MYGAVSGMLVGMVLQPLEIIKMAIIINPMHNKQLDKANFVKSFYIAARHIFDTEGVKGFWRGILPSLSRTACGGAIYFQTLEHFE